MDAALKEKLVTAQRFELTEHYVYRSIARREKNEHNRAVLGRIAADELRHYQFWATFTGEQPKEYRMRLIFFDWISRLLGITFAIKLMEKTEESAQGHYANIVEAIPEAEAIMKDEDAHERELTAMVDEERLKYTGAIVLGLNDALVELTGALAGLTLALRDNRLIAMTGLITGIAAAMSMAASEYLSIGAETATDKSPVKGAVYTGIAYIFTVAVLIAPFLLMANSLAALGVTLVFALLIIFGFTYYNSVAQDLPLRHRFLEMAGLSLGVALISFGVGYVVRIFFGVEI